MKYTIESRWDELVVIRDSRGFHIVVNGLFPAYQFANLKQAQLSLSALQYTRNLHSGFKIHEVKS
jgi:hypothetical protein